MSDATTAASEGFAALGLAPEVLRAIAELGYEAPSAIQAASVPPLLAGRDLLGQAQTGTGKTAAFALPILSRLEASSRAVQALVLTPTRELALQVAEAFARYARGLRNFHVLPIYGGQGYAAQLGGLKRGAHVVVGTPGRVIDHLERGSLDLSALRFLVLDEADEMLRMGFAEAVESILARTPATRQTALFSATLPAPIQRIAAAHLRDPVTVRIARETPTAAAIEQRYWLVSGLHKLDALTRILEVEPYTAMIVFVRTKLASDELAQKLVARGHAAAAIHGDLAQVQRERIIQSLRDGAIDLLVATDVAARGLDVDRISHVVNYDIPYDTESYVHRIGRTGRAGRTGSAILFVTPRERHLLRAIERTTRQRIEALELPSVARVNDRRIARFFARIDAARGSPDLALYQQLIARYESEHGVAAVEIAAALARMLHGGTPLLLSETATPPSATAPERPRRPPAAPRHDRRPAAAEPRATRPASATPDTARDRTSRPRGQASRGPGALPTYVGYRVEVGREHGIDAQSLAALIARESGLDPRYVGSITLAATHSRIELPDGMPKEILRHLKKVQCAGRTLAMVRLDPEAPEAAKRRPGRKP